MSRPLGVTSTWGERARSALGLAVMLGIAWLFSTNRRRIPWRLVGVGVTLQIGLGLLTRTAAGAWFFAGFNEMVTSLLAYTTEGSAFIFGDLARPGHTAYIAFGVLPTIIFFSSLMALFYHAGIMPQLVRLIALGVQRVMGTSGAETLSAAGNIFVGQTEAPLLIRPFIAGMTTSELMAVMTGGFATVAGGVMIAYVGMLQGVFPDIAGHLLSASIMSAPAALVTAKILVPETETPKTLGGVHLDLPKTDANMLDAAARGAGEGLTLALNVGAMLLAFTALVATANGLLGWLSGNLLGFDTPLTLELMLGWLGAPLAWIMGIRWEDAQTVGSLLGVKTILNEFVAYLQLSQQADGIAPRSMVIATYALCGFANLGSIGIQLGGISPLAPERRPDLARLAVRAVLGGTLAAFMTACVIGVLI
ncbi:MAG: nucleoside transporter C-terminal domain-containing protein [Myxococcota bacterium]